ncbi:hypothetical protein ACIQXV_09620 [Neobacillus sp. NPDC097160]|uniref:hypothetical protein n=1 Tax=Neobacillus sp. NPDC097160 TaxID=3364298 RepID=UPI0037F2AD6F
MALITGKQYRDLLVLIPWDNVLFHRFLESTAYIRSTLHRYSAFNYIHRIQLRDDFFNRGRFIF